MTEQKVFRVRLWGGGVAHVRAVSFDRACDLVEDHVWSDADGPGVVERTLDGETWQHRDGSRSRSCYWTPNATQRDAP